VKVQFLRDFQGRATKENYYTAGTVVDLPDWQASACLAEKVVSVVSVAEVPPLAEPVAVPPPPAATGSDDYAAPVSPKPARKRAAGKKAPKP
jgi:hypothetical protein